MRIGHRRAVALRGALLASVAVLVALPSAGEAATARAAVPSAGPCADAKGVTVVVDFGALGGGTKVRCAPAPVSSGFNALTRAGFTFEGTARFPGLLCRIDGKPADDPCQNAPSNERYWAYWYGPRGGEWTYSSSGAGSRKPPPGSVEGWAFGDNAKPSIDPPAPTPTTTTTTRGGGATVPTSPGASTTSPPGGSPATAPGDPGTTPTTAAGAPGSTTSVDPGASDDTTTTTSPDGELAAAPDSGGGSTGGSDSGSPMGAIVAVLAAVGLGAAAWWRSRRAGAGPV